MPLTPGLAQVPTAVVSALIGLVSTSVRGDFTGMPVPEGASEK